MTYPARCPRCGAHTIDALLQSPDVPIYGCGSWGRRIVCAPVMAADVQNVAALTRGDSAELLELVDAADLAVMRAGSRAG